MDLRHRVAYDTQDASVYADLTTEQKKIDADVDVATGFEQVEGTIQLSGAQLVVPGLSADSLRALVLRHQETESVLTLATAILDAAALSFLGLGDAAVEGPMTTGHATVFPNFSYLPVNGSIRIWHPKGPDKIEVWAWVLVDKSWPDDVKDAQRLYNLRTFGPSGIFEADDGENWSEIQAISHGFVTNSVPLNFQMGIGSVPTAVGLALRDKKDLGVHTELFTDPVLDLVEAGAITGAAKEINRGKIVSAFLMFIVSRATAGSLPAPLQRVADAPQQRVEGEEEPLRLAHLVAHEVHGGVRPLARDGAEEEAGVVAPRQTPERGRLRAEAHLHRLPLQRPQLPAAPHPHPVQQLQELRVCLQQRQRQGDEELARPPRLLRVVEARAAAFRDRPRERELRHQPVGAVDGLGCPDGRGARSVA